MKPTSHPWILIALCSAVLASLACACATPVRMGGANPGPAEGTVCVPGQDSQACSYKGTSSSVLRCEAGAWIAVTACPAGTQCLQGPGASGIAAACVPLADVADALSAGADADTDVNAGAQDLLDSDTAFSDAEAQDLLDSDTAKLPPDALSTGEDCDCLKPGMTFRFNKLQIQSLDGDPDQMIIGTLNPLWKGDMDNKELNFYLEIKDVSTTEIQLRIVNGARIDKAGNVCTLPATSNTVTMQRDGCKIKNAIATALNVYAGTPANPKNCTTGLEVPHAIPLRNVYLSAEIAPACAGVVNGWVKESAISKNSLDNTCTCLTLGGKPAEDCGTPDGNFAGYPSAENATGVPPTFCTACCKGCNEKFTNLKELLEMFAGAGGMQYKCKDEKGQPAVCLEAMFTAAKVDKVPADCPK